MSNDDRGAGVGHRPGPWHTHGAVIYTEEKVAIAHMAITPGHTITPGEPEKREATARYIVRACNAHEGLVGIVERFVLATKEEDVDALSKVFFEAMLALVEEREA